MNTKTMEGLAGANTNLNLTNVPMKVYKEASRKGDIAAMTRAIGYTVEFTEKAYEYKKKANEGLKEDAEAVREKEKLEREKTIEKRREEHEKLQAGIEEIKTSQPDTLEVSEEGSVLLQDILKSDKINSSKGTADSGKEPVIYTKTGKAKQMEQSCSISCSV